MNSRQLFNQIRQKKSFLCVGLDTDPGKIPPHLLGTDDPVFAFNRVIVDATAAYTIAYKPNLAFYESRGLEGWKSLERTVRFIREKYPEIFLIADAKRGDIGNTSKMYASAFFGGLSGLDFDAVTVAPYMGVDSVSPFLEYPGKWVILLALTSNKGGADFQLLKEAGSGMMLFEKVLETSRKWGSEEQLMYVVGATRAEWLAEVRKLVPRHFLLVPGVGAQGGSLQEVARFGMNQHCGLIVNSSRAILYADRTERFAEAAGQAAAEVQAEMEILLRENNLI